jgi:gas vesicle structural protein
MEELDIIDEDEELSLLETLDHVLDRGLVIAGEVTIAVADIDLIYLGLNLLLGSVESVNRVLGTRERRVELLLAGARRAVAAGEQVETKKDAHDDAAEG